MPAHAATALFAFRTFIDHAAAGRVFMDPFFAQVRDGDDDDRLDQLPANQVLSGFVDPPFHVREGGGLVENVLPIMQIENGISSGGRAAVTEREIDQNITAVGQDLGTESPMFLNVSGKRVIGHRAETHRREKRTCLGECGGSELVE